MASIVYNEDCLEAMRSIPDKAFDLAIVDPPYGLPKGSCHGRGRLKKIAFNNGRINQWDIPPTREYFDELFRVSRNQIIWGGNYFGLPRTRCVIAWDKYQPWENFSQWEMAWTSFDRPASLFRLKNTHSGKIHPTQKPVELYRWLLEKYANPGDRILDTHVGSGSSRIAAVALGFEFTGYEISKEYFEAQEIRFQNAMKGQFECAENQLNLFEE